MDREGVENDGGRGQNRTADPCDVNAGLPRKTLAKSCKRARADRDSCSLRSPNSWAKPGRDVWARRAMFWLNSTTERVDDEAEEKLAPVLALFQNNRSAKGLPVMRKYMRKEWFLRRLAMARENVEADIQELAASGHADLAAVALAYRKALDDVENMLLRRGDPVDAKGYWKP